jgi:hypothetical protein
LSRQVQFKQALGMIAANFFNKILGQGNPSLFFFQYEEKFHVLERSLKTLPNKGRTFEVGIPGLGIPLL